MVRQRVFASPSDLKQGHLEAVIRDIFPDKHVITNARSSANVISPFTGHFLELDYWLPEIKLAFEFQDPYHYISTWYANKSLAYIQERDRVKKQDVEDRGETLISVPCWWDGEKDSLIATIRARRHDLFAAVPKAKPIEDEPPAGFFTVGTIPNVGELMQATFIESNTVCIDSWWISEKYDGVRGCWNPLLKTVHGRFGTLLPIAEKLLLALPGCFIDGEIWFGRRSFRQAREALSVPPRDIAVCETFENFRFVAFDCPNPALDSSPFESRFTNIVSTQDDHSFVTIVALRRCKDSVQAKKFTELILESGGEGTVLREPKSLYIHGKSNHLLKIKAHRVDQEALVTRQMANGEYLLKLPTGLEFVAKISPHSEDCPRKGDVVTFAYNHYHSGNFIGAQILCVRADLEWENILADPELHTTKVQQINNTGKRVMNEPQLRKPKGHWTNDDAINTKEFFDNFAKRRNFDPLVATNWYSFMLQDFLLEPDGLSVLANYDKSFVRALLDVYPSVGIDSSRFLNVARNFWKETLNRRKFFNKFAVKHSFDPLIAANWYRFTHTDVISERGGLSVMDLFDNNLPRALCDAYPNLTWDDTKFMSFYRNIFRIAKHRKKFLEDFAAKHKFDPLESSNWYSITRDTILQEKGGPMFLEHYKRNLPNALIDVFPSIGIIKSRFYVGSDFWMEKEHRKTFWQSFAQKYNFDPLVASNWYHSISKNSVLRKTGGAFILRLHGGSLADALVDIYPQLGPINDEEFEDTVNYWKHSTHRRKFFDEFASKRSFDPLIVDNWYPISLKDILDEPEGPRVVLQHTTFVNALKDLYPELTFNEKRFYHYRTRSLGNTS